MAKVLSPGTPNFYFDERTPLAVMALLSTTCRVYRSRFWFGDTETGLVWQEEYDVIGRVGFSMGPQRIPLLIKTKRSYGGTGILDHCILRIDCKYNNRATGWQTVYEHEKFWLPIYETRYCEDYEEYDAEVVIHSPDGHEHPDDGQVVARFKTNAQALRWTQFMSGLRYSK